MDDLMLPTIAMWQYLQSTLIEAPPTYVRKPRVSRRRPPRWDPWFNTDLCAEEVFVQHFRMGRPDFLWLCDHLRPMLQLDPLGRGNPLSVEAQVAVGLYHLGHGASHLTVAHVFHIGKETSWKTTRRFVKAVLVLLHRQTIGFPGLDQTDRWKEIAEAFEETNGIPDVIGAIDGTHIPIVKPANDEWHAYINRKGWNSILFQCVVDGDGNFRNVYGGIAGSIHDARLFRISNLGRKINSNTAPFPSPFMLIGDSGYPGNNQILIPYSSTPTEAQKRFNFIHSSTRMVVEQAFGRLKNRFRILLSPQNATPKHARNVTVACMIIHNILNRRGSLYLQIWDERIDHELQFGDVSTSTNGITEVDQSQVGVSVRRDQICQMLCS